MIYLHETVLLIAENLLIQILASNELTGSFCLDHNTLANEKLVYNGFLLKQFIPAD